MDPTALMDQIKAEVENGDTKARANLALALFQAQSKSLDVATLAAFAALFTRQEVVFEKLDALQEKIDNLAALIVSKG